MTTPDPSRSGMTPETRRALSDAEIAQLYRRIQAQTLIDLVNSGDDMPLDDEGKVVPSERAFMTIYHQYRVESEEVGGTRVLTVPKDVVIPA